MPTAERILDPEILARISSLSLRARQLADGILSGLHKSRHMGVSVEFDSHKEYSPGDEVRHLDWKVFGKSDKYYVKRYEQETNRRALLLVDTSGSMGYGSGSDTKYDAAAVSAAALAYIMLAQGDAVGLMTFGERETKYIPARSVSAHLQTIVTGLASVEPSGPTDIPGTLSRLSEKLKGRGMLILFSDLFDEPAAVRHFLKLHHSRKQEVVVFHVLDKNEIAFPFRDLTLFKGMEDDIEALAEPEVIASEYRRLVAEFIGDHQNNFRHQGIDYRLMDTGLPLADTLFDFLAARAGGNGRLSGGRGR